MPEYAGWWKKRGGGLEMESLDVAGFNEKVSENA